VFYRVAGTRRCAAKASTTMSTTNDEDMSNTTTVKTEETKDKETKDNKTQTTSPDEDTSNTTVETEETKDNKTQTTSPDEDTPNTTVETEETKDNKTQPTSPDKEGDDDDEAALLIQTKEMETIFGVLADGDGTLSVTSFHAILHEMGLNPTEAEMLDLLTTIDMDLESHLSLENFRTLIEEYEGHDATLHEIIGGTDAPPLHKSLNSHGSVQRLQKDDHSDFYWVHITKEEWPAFPTGFTLNEQYRITAFAPPAAFLAPVQAATRALLIDPTTGDPTAAATTTRRVADEKDILQMVDERRIEKRFPSSSIIAIITARLAMNGHVNLKFRRHIDHAKYSGEYVVGFTTKVPDVGMVDKNVIMGPIDTNSDAYHQGICHGDLILSINNEEHFNALSTQSFKQICEAALFRDGKLTLHLEHSEHRAEFHHDILHENVHKGLRAVFGGMCCSSGVNANAGAGEKYQMEKGKSLADLV
jgi:hypothetical protein